MELVNKPPKLRKTWSTHMPMLIKTIQLTTGPVLELGAGVFSTPLIHWLCAEDRRHIVTCEDHWDYFHFARGFRSRTHSIKLISNWYTEIEQYKTRRWDVIFIDNNDETRADLAIMLKDHGYFILLHDSDHEKFYGYDRVYPHFAYRYDWTFSRSWTTVVSNYDNLQRLKRA